MENNSLMVIEWKRWSWKTLLSTIIVGMNPSRHFYGNFLVNAENFTYFDDFDNLVSLLKEKWRGQKNNCIIIDEAQKLLNSRLFKDKLNMKVLRFIVESRKYWCDVILIAQEFRAIDKQIREQSDYLLTLFWEDMPWWDKKIIIVNNERTDERDEDWDLIFSPSWVMQLENVISILKSTWLIYNTNESVVLN